MGKQPRLVDYPWVVVRIACPTCGRHGRTRLAEKYGAEITLDDLLDRIAWTCPYPRHPPAGQKRRKLHVYSGVWLPDLVHLIPPPPHLPSPRLRLVLRDDDAAA